MPLNLPRRSEIVLEFDPDDEDFAVLAGHEITCRSMSIAEAEDVDAAISDPDDERGMVGVLVEDVIVSWQSANGDNVPVTVETMRGLEPWVPQVIYRAWVRGLLSPPKASPPASRNGHSSTPLPRSTAGKSRRSRTS